MAASFPVNAAASARSFLFLPADRLDRLPKALASEAHALVIDFEDAVAPDHKPGARKALASLWPTLATVTRRRVMVRISACGSPWHAADMALLGDLDGLSAVMPAKTESADDLLHLLTPHTTQRWCVPLIESAEGLARIDAIARVPGVLRLAFGHLDFQVDLGMACGVEETELDAVRLAFVTASRRAGLASPVDGVTATLQDPGRLETDARRARRFGFGGKLCVHPAQAPIVNEALGPTEAERGWAVRVLEAALRHANGVFPFEGSMVDAPVLARARRILDQPL